MGSNSIANNGANRALFSAAGEDPATEFLNGAARAGKLDGHVRAWSSDSNSSNSMNKGGKKKAVMWRDQGKESSPSSTAQSMGRG